MTDDELDRRVRESLLAEEIDTSRVERAVRSQMRSPRVVPRWAAVAAGIVAMIAASTFSYRTFQKERAIPPVCVAALQDHQREIVDREPRLWLSNLSEIQALGAQRGVPASAIAALATTGYRLERGRLCFLQKQIYLHLVFRRDGTEYSVYLRSHANQPAFSNTVQGSEKLAYFETKGVTAVFVSQTAGAGAFARAGAKVLQGLPS